MPFASVFNLLGTPQWLRWLALASAVAGVTTWLIVQVGFLFVLAGILWAVAAWMFLRRMIPVGLTQMRGGTVSPSPGGTPVPQPPATPMPAPVAATLPAPTITPASALAKGRAAVEAMHGLDTVRGELQALSAALKGASKSVRNGTLIVLEGPAGTGKKAVAENLALMLFGIGHLARPEPYVVEADEALAINPAQWFDAMSRVAAAAGGCALVFRHAGWLAQKDGAEAVGRALARAVDRQPGLTVILTGPTGLGSRMSNGVLRKAWLGRFKLHVIAFPALSVAAVRAMLADLAIAHDLRFDGGGDLKLAAGLAELSKGEGYENAVTVHALFDDARAIAAKRAAALGKPVSVISAADAETAIELSTLSMAQTPIRFGNTAVPAAAGRRSDMLADVHREMSNMVGLGTVKDEIDRIVAFASLKKLRRERNLPSPPISMHMVFRGPPGTGKTEVARKIARILYGIKFIRHAEVVEVDRSTITSQFANETPKVVGSKVKEALGGVLFIDEAYTLAGSNALNATPDKAGKEAIDTLMKAMEDNRDNLVVICAGYTNEMNQFLDSNPGLKSRFGFFIDFPAYQPHELRQIFDGLVQQYQYRLTDDASREVDAMLGDMQTQASRNDFGNAREVRLKFEKIAMAQAARIGLNDDLEALTENQLVTLERDDIEAAQ